jgi:hypothetical protein
VPDLQTNVKAAANLATLPAGANKHKAIKEAVTAELVRMLDPGTPPPFAPPGVQPRADLRRHVPRRRVRPAQAERGQGRDPVLPQLRGDGPRQGRRGRRASRRSVTRSATT